MLVDLSMWGAASQAASALTCSVFCPFGCEQPYVPSLLLWSIATTVSAGAVYLRTTQAYSGGGCANRGSLYGVIIMVFYIVVYYIILLYIILYCILCYILSSNISYFCCLVSCSS